MKRFFIGFTAVALITAMACKKDDPPPQTAYPTATAPATGPYPTATGPYPTATGTVAPVPTGPAAGTMAVPGPLAFACQNDSACGLAHCNVQYQKCAYPCVSGAIDCVQGAACLTATGLCVPAGTPGAQ